MNKKYELTDEIRGGLHRIRALRDIECFGVKEGDFGGYIESEENLSQEGDAWVHDNAEVYDNARVYGNARVFGSAFISGNTWIHENASVYDDARIYDRAQVCGNASVYGSARVYGNASVYGYSRISGDAQVEYDSDYCAFNHVGSENGTLTVCKSQSGALLAARGCFSGTLDEFEAAVSKNSTAQIQKEYELLIEFARLRLGNKS